MLESNKITLSRSKSVYLAVGNFVSKLIVFFAYAKIRFFFYFSSSSGLLWLLHLMWKWLLTVTSPHRIIIWASRQHLTQSFYHLSVHLFRLFWPPTTSWFLLTALHNFVFFCEKLCPICSAPNCRLTKLVSVMKCSGGFNWQTAILFSQDPKTKQIEKNTWEKQTVILYVVSCLKCNQGCTLYVMMTPLSSDSRDERDVCLQSPDTCVHLLSLTNKLPFSTKPLIFLSYFPEISYWTC